MILFSLAEPPSPRPQPDTPTLAKSRPKRTELDQKEPNSPKWIELYRLAGSLGWGPGGGGWFVGMRGVVREKRKSQSLECMKVDFFCADAHDRKSQHVHDPKVWMKITLGRGPGGANGNK